MLQCLFPSSIVKWRTSLITGGISFTLLLGSAITGFVNASQIPTLTTISPIPTVVLFSLTPISSRKRRIRRNWLLWGCWNGTNHELQLKFQSTERKCQKLWMSKWALGIFSSPDRANYQSKAFESVSIYRVNSAFNFFCSPFNRQYLVWTFPWTFWGSILASKLVFSCKLRFQ